MKVKVTLEINIADGFLDANNPSEIDWFFNEILNTENGIYLYSEAIGDEVGEITKILNTEQLCYQTK